LDVVTTSGSDTDLAIGVENLALSTVWRAVVAMVLAAI
jgi:hypothetical protein